ncbi:MAG: single-stranded-DNA-specific exonuclease RecJ [Elusimicrobiota bacterium]|jgi:single-stranded-DNA-specific exonuclease|nr:single-stranded-DNA-specific exonuclease RecJ [Elusimicrobiota bacterium]
MDFIKKNWKFVGTSHKNLPESMLALGVNPKILSSLFSRGVISDRKAEIFMRGGLEYIHSPFLFKQMQKAVDRIKKAINLKEHILVYGDRDVDGVTAVNIIVDTIKNYGGDVEWYIPFDEGYGIHKDILSKYASDNVKVLITVDCGMSAKEEVEYAKGLGIDVILTDHHEPVEDTIPNPFALINPKMQGTKYPFKNIAGCAVSLKLAQALVMTYGRQYNKYNLLFSAQKNGDDFNGELLWLSNDVELERKSFSGIDELRKELKVAYRIYTFSAPAAEALIKKDILLKDKIIVFDKPQKDDIESLITQKVKMDYNADRMKDFFESALDICALGTIADSMPLIDENKIIVSEGLKIIAANPHQRPGLGLLIEDTLKTKDSYNISVQSVSRNIIPMLNSAGRMGRGALSAQLLFARDKFQAQALYTDIIKLNDERKELQFENIEQFKNLLREQCDPDNDKVIIIKASNLELGVTGIIASGMVKTYSKPAFLLISGGDEAVGAARSVEGFNIVNALESVKDILIKYGGHSQAAGFTIEDSKIDEFKRRIIDYAKKNLVEIEPLNSIIIENELKISDINIDFYNQIESLSPFGMGNPRPIFCIKGVNVTEVYVFGSKREHLKFKVSQKGSRNVQAVFWNKSRYGDIIRKDDFFDLAFCLDIADKNGEAVVQLSVIDIKPSY